MSTLQAFRTGPAAHVDLEAPSQPRRIAVITTYARSLARFRARLMGSWLERGIEVFALAPDYTAKEEEEMRALGVRPIPIPMSRAGLSPMEDLATLRALARVLAEIRADATFSYFAKAVAYGTLAARRAGVPRRFCLVSGRGTALAPAGGGRAFGERIAYHVALSLYRRAFRLADKVFFQNADDLAFFVSRRAVAADRAVLVAGSGVDLETFSASPPPTSPVTFLMMARLIEEKGVREFIDAGRIVRGQDPSVRLVLLGDIDENPRSLRREEIEAAVREGVIEWPGEVHDVRPWLQEASVFVLPSYYGEGVPRSILEAMACGRPVITTRMPGCRDTVEEEVNGMLVPPRDVAALARAMEQFRADPASIVRMGSASRRLAEDRFDVNAVNDRINSAMGLDGQEGLE